MQTTDVTLMIRPVNFSANQQTMESNAFQKPGAESPQEINNGAVVEFDAMVQLLRAEGIMVIVIDDTESPATPDSIFPNNWISFHADGTVVLYPMQAENRRLERRGDILEKLAAGDHFIETRIVDLTPFEADDAFLEGTGSMVLDRDNKIAYACLSPRTNKTVLDKFCSELGYGQVIFHATGSDGTAIYHTNVMMCVGSRFILICLESIQDQQERELVTRQIYQSGKTLISISREQMNQFAGNMLELKNGFGDALLVMSSSAFEATESLHKELSHFCKIIHTPLAVIEKNGGGSARCMIAEIHLPHVSVV